MQSSPEQYQAAANSLQAELLRYSVFHSTRFVPGKKPRIVASGNKGAVMVRLDQVVRPIREVAHNAAIRFVQRRMR